MSEIVASEKAPRVGHIVLGVSASIAAYKAAELTSLLAQRGHQVTVVMTDGAQQFISALTFRTLSRNSVITSLWDEVESQRPGHIEVADAADLFVIAPATADLISRLALGLANDAISSMALATLAPLLIAPAMNGKMWLHAATQAHVATLKSRGAHFIGPEEGMLACGYEGAGRLWPVPEIARRAEELLGEKVEL